MCLLKSSWISIRWKRLFSTTEQGKSTHSTACGARLSSGATSCILAPRIILKEQPIVLVRWILIHWRNAARIVNFVGWRTTCHASWFSCFDYRNYRGLSNASCSSTHSTEIWETSKFALTHVITYVIIIILVRAGSLRIGIRFPTIFIGVSLDTHSSHVKGARDQRLIVRSLRPLVSHTRCSTSHIILGSSRIWSRYPYATRNRAPVFGLRPSPRIVGIIRLAETSSSTVLRRISQIKYSDLRYSSQIAHSAEVKRGYAACTSTALVVVIYSNHTAKISATIMAVLGCYNATTSTVAPLPSFLLLLLLKLLKLGVCIVFRVPQFTSCVLASGIASIAHGGSWVFHLRVSSTTSSNTWSATHSRIFIRSICSSMCAIIGSFDTARTSPTSERVV